MNWNEVRESELTTPCFNPTCMYIFNLDVGMYLFFTYLISVKGRSANGKEPWGKNLDLSSHARYMVT